MPAGRVRRRQAKPGKPYSLPPEIRSSATGAQLRTGAQGRAGTNGWPPSRLCARSRTARPRPRGSSSFRDSSATRRSLGVSSSREAARPPIRDSSARARSAQSGALHSSKSVRAASSALAPRAFASPADESARGRAGLDRARAAQAALQMSRSPPARTPRRRRASYRGDERLAPAQRSRRARVTSPADVRLEPGEHSFRLAPSRGRRAPRCRRRGGGRGGVADSRSRDERFEHRVGGRRTAEWLEESSARSAERTMTS